MKRINGSKLGELNFLIPFSSGGIKPPHVKQIGPAYPLFLRLEDMVTTGEGTTGIVLGGKPVRDEDLAEYLGLSRRAVNDLRRRLEKYGYIKTEHRREGNAIWVLKSKKLMLLRKLRAEESQPEIGGNPPPHGEILPPDGDILPSGPSVPINDQAVTKQGRGRGKTASRVPHPLHHEIRTWCSGEWEQRFGKKPPWDGRDNKALKELLEARQDLTLAEVQQVWANYMGSTKKFYDDNGWPLRAFCQDFAGLSLHPVHDRGRQGTAPTAKPNGQGASTGKFAAYSRRTA